MVLNVIFVISLLLPVSYAYGTQAQIDEKRKQRFGNTLQELPGKIVAIPVLEIVRNASLILLDNNEATFNIQKRLNSPFDRNDYAGQTGDELINNLQKDEKIKIVDKKISNVDSLCCAQLAQAFNSVPNLSGNAVSTMQIAALALATEENKVYAAMSEECKQVSREAGMKILTFLNPMLVAKRLKVKSKTLLGKLGTINEETYKKCYCTFYGGCKGILKGKRAKKLIQDVNTKIKDSTIPEKEEIPLKKPLIFESSLQSHHNDAYDKRMLAQFLQRSLIVSREEPPFKKQRYNGDENK